VTGDDVKAAVLRKLKRPSDDDSLDDDILALVNEAYGIMATEPAFAAEQTLAFAAGDKYKALEAGTVRVREAYINGEPQGLRRVNDSEIYRYGSLNTTGKPRMFWEENERLYVYPTPEASYTIKAVAEGAVTALANLAATLAVAPAYAQCAHWYVTWQLAAPEKGDLQALANECKENWAALIEKAWEIDRARRRRKYGGPIPQRTRSRVGPRILTNTVLDDL
jgi:hypothetical protein